MKKKTSLIVFTISIILLALAFLIIKFDNSEKTIEEAINKSYSMPLNIIHKEKTYKGSIVFCNTLDKNTLYTAIVKKNILGFKVVYSGIQTDIKLVTNVFGITYDYFPGIKKIPLPIYFGLIGNPDISKVKIVEKKRNIESEARIINSNGIRIWIMHMDKFQGSDFDIICLSTNGKELSKIDGDI